MNVERIKEFKIMKALRYLLMVVAMVSVLSVHAQSTAQLPSSDFRSTSIMQNSGSMLPQAATTGAVLTGETPGTYSSVYHPGGPRKTVVDGGDGDGWDDEDGDNPDKKEDEPFPIGDAIWPLMVLAGLYLIIRVGRKRAREDVNKTK